MTNAKIIACIGANGSGKTLCAVTRYAAPALRRGKEVVANFTIEGGRKLRDHREIPELTNCLLILDEISAAFPSRGSHTMPPEIVRTLNQLRKVGVTVVWTAPSWKRADTVLREVTGRVILCRGYLGPKPKVCMDGDCTEPDCTIRRHQRRDPDGWSNQRLFRWVHYSTEMVEEFRLGTVSETQGERKARAVYKEWYWRPRDGSGPQSMYDTLEPVQLMDHLDESGNCFSCGGKRTRKACKCDKGEP